MKIESKNFRFQENQEILKELTIYFLHNYLKGQELFLSYNEKILTQIVKQLNPKNSIIFLLSPDYQYRDQSISENKRIFMSFLQEQNKGKNKVHNMIKHKKGKQPYFEKHKLNIMDKDFVSNPFLSFKNDIFKQEYDLRKMSPELINNFTIGNNLTSEMQIPGENKYIPDQFEMIQRCGQDEIEQTYVKKKKSKTFKLFDSFLQFDETDKTVRVDKHIMKKIKQQQLRTKQLANERNSKMKTSMESMGAPRNMEYVCSRKSVIDDKEQDYPQVVYNDTSISIWHKLERSFEVPKVQIMVDFISPIISRDQKSFIMTNLLSNLIQDYLGEVLYDATLIGFQVKVRASLQGLNLHISGFSNKIQQIYIDVISKLKSMKIPETRFELIKESIEKLMQDMWMQKTDILAKNILLKILKKQYYIYQDLIPFINNISYDDIQKFQQEFFEKLYLKMLFVGNILDSTAYNLGIKTVSILQYKPLDVQIQQDQILDIKNSSLIYKMTNENLFDDSHVILNYYQNGIFDYKSHAYMQLISQTMENEAQIYLRDTLHLGYMTYTQFLSEESIEGQIIVIVGNKYPHENDKNIELYLKKVQNIIGNFTEDNFQKLKDQYLNSIKPNNQNLEMLTIKYWNEISHDTYDFERNKDIIEIMDELTLQDLIEFYSSFIQKQAKISIQIYSKNTSYKILNETIQQSANHTQTETQLVHDLNKIDIQNRYPSQRIDIQNINNQNKIFEKFIGS